MNRRFRLLQGHGNRHLCLNRITLYTEEPRMSYSLMDGSPSLVSRMMVREDEEAIALENSLALREHGSQPDSELLGICALHL